MKSEIILIFAAKFIEKMKITLLQQNIVWGNPTANHRRAEAAILRAPGADLYVLPEMFSTGFATEPKGLAEQENASLQWMKATARRQDAALAGSVAVEVDGTYRNRLYFVTPDGAVTFYDKHHLFSYAGEQNSYTPGQERVIVNFRGVRFLLMVCYDLRFPVWSRNNDEYDCALYVANWPSSRMPAWDYLLRARAIENQCYVCGVNRVGDDSVCHYMGGSMLVHPYGHAMATAPEGQEGCATAELDMPALEAFRTKFGVLNDRDCFVIHNT